MFSPQMITQARSSCYSASPYPLWLLRCLGQYYRENKDHVAPTTPHFSGFVGPDDSRGPRPLHAWGFSWPESSRWLPSSGPRWRVGGRTNNQGHRQGVLTPGPRVFKRPARSKKCSETREKSPPITRSIELHRRIASALRCPQPNFGVKVRRESEGGLAGQGGAT
jgi:hypothetical protein